MCLAVPVQIISVSGDRAEVVIGGNIRQVSILLTPEAKIGDYVLLHTGYAISIIDEKEAQETLTMFERMVDTDEIH
jgi:hydrogenase expression/formation protein HypC